MPRRILAPFAILYHGTRNGLGKLRSPRQLREDLGIVRRDIPKLPGFIGAVGRNSAGRLRGLFKPGTWRGRAKYGRRAASRRDSK